MISIISLAENTEMAETDIVIRNCYTRCRRLYESVSVKISTWLATTAMALNT
jgi:hypothetical protein